MILDSRPWGFFSVLSDEKNYKVKKILVNIGCRLSYQLHQKRNEHWFVIQGRGKVTINNLEYEICKGGSIDIPKQSKHRIENIGEESLIFIEIQTGEYFGEDDIFRIEDDYHRL